jgi:hypothetical protein
MDFLQSHLQFFAEHPFSVVFFALLIEAAGIPFPTRIILILAPAFIDTDRDPGTTGHRGGHRCGAG